MDDLSKPTFVSRVYLYTICVLTILFSDDLHHSMMTFMLSINGLSADNKR